VKPRLDWWGKGCKEQYGVDNEEVFALVAQLEMLLGLLISLLAA
jgi:hypothetical protein